MYSAIPSHFFIPDPIDLRESYVFVPLIGELLCCVWQLGETKLVTEILGNALSNLKILSEHDQLIFGTRLRIDFSAVQRVICNIPTKSITRNFLRRTLSSIIILN